MTVADARVKVTLPDHPKMKKLIRKCGQAGAWNLIRLFLFTAANRSDGDLAGMDDDDLEIAADWQGEPGAFVAALAEVKFLTGEQGSRVVHDWADHNPWANGAEARSEKSRWAALCKQRGRQKAAEMMPEYAAGLLKASAEGATGMPTAVPDSAIGMPLADSGSAPSPSPSPFQDQEQDQKPSAGKPPRKSKREVASEYPLPEWLDRSLWAKWIAVRTKPDAGLPENVAKLTNWRNQGFDPSRVLLEAIAGGWQGLYLPKELTHENRIQSGGSLSAVERVRAAIAANRGPGGVIDAKFDRVA